MESNGDPSFSTTNWSVVVAAAQSDPVAASHAMERLCGRYWYPIYAFVRQRGHDLHESQDLAQSFFQFLVERRTLQQVQRERGRFRTFILTALTNFLHNERDKGQTHKRGGRHQIVSLDGEFAESAYALESRNDSSAEALFDRGWAATLIQRVMAELQKEFLGRGKSELFSGMQPFLTGEPTAADYAEIGCRLTMEPGAVKVALHRARRRFGELLRSEVAHTVSQPEEVEAEIRHLLAGIAE